MSDSRTGAGTTVPARRVKEVESVLEVRRVQEYNASVIAAERINPELAVIRVRPDGDVFEFEAGQFATLGLLAGEDRVDYAEEERKTHPPEKMIKRAYSIASGSVQRDYIEFIITLVIDGQLTPRLFNLERGDRIFMAPKAKGKFTLTNVPEHKHLILIATGTGLAPYVSFVRSHLQHGEDKRRFILLHGCRYSWDLGYRNELESLARVTPNLVYIPTITRNQVDRFFVGEVGRLPQLIQSGIIERHSGLSWDPEQVDVFMCGNPAMIQDLTPWLEKRGFREDAKDAPGTIHTEKYW